MTKSHQEMERVNMMMWINTSLCLPLTILIRRGSNFVVCAVQRDKAPVIYYVNLLIANLIQLCTMMVWSAKLKEDQTLITCLIFFFFGMLTSLYFKTCIALERCFFITCPLLDCIRQTEGSVLVCVLIWVLCIVTAPLVVLLEQIVRIFIFTLFPAPLFIFCLAGTVKALPAATSVPTEQKQRIVGTLVLLLLNYFLIILPTTFCFILMVPGFAYSFKSPDSVLIWFMLIPFMDLILLIFLGTEQTEKLLASLCWCGTDDTENADVEEGYRRD